jgi:hypothetical protein
VNVWHIVTSEYPPDVGGVSDYCAVVAAGLAAAGDEVHVWCGSGSRIPDPRSPIPDPRSPIPDPRSRVHVHPVLGTFTPRDLRRADRLLDRFAAPRRLLVQWVPHGFGYRSLNVPFCAWISRRARRINRVIAQSRRVRKARSCKPLPRSSSG